MALYFPRNAYTSWQLTHIVSDPASKPLDRDDIRSTSLEETTTLLHYERKRDRSAHKVSTYVGYGAYFLSVAHNFSPVSFLIKTGMLIVANKCVIPYLTEGPEYERVIIKGPSRNDITEYFFSKIKAIPEAKALYEEACSEQKKFHERKYNQLNSISLFFWPRTFSITRNATSELSKGFIHIRLGVTEDEIASRVVFELGNIAHQALFYNIHDRVKHKEIQDPESYAKEMERAEFSTLKRHRKIMVQAVEKFGWSFAADFNKDLDIINWDFEAAWERYIKHSIHAQNYRKQFYRLQRQMLSE